jgi:opacity protein-like surface antigen
MNAMAAALFAALLAFASLAGAVKDTRPVDTFPSRLAGDGSSPADGWQHTVDAVHAWLTHSRSASVLKHDKVTEMLDVVSVGPLRTRWVVNSTHHALAFAPRWSGLCGARCLP